MTAAAPLYHLARAGTEVAPLYTLWVDGRLQAPGILASAWLTAGETVWVRQERMRVSQLVQEDGTAVFDGLLDCRVHRARRQHQHVKGSVAFVVVRVAPMEALDGLPGAVYLQRVHP